MWSALKFGSSWPDILADLNSLTETEVEQDGKRFILRSAPRRSRHRNLAVADRDEVLSWACSPAIHCDIAGSSIKIKTALSTTSSPGK